MKCVRAWLAEWVDPLPSQQELAEILTAAGLEATEAGEDVLELDLTPNRGDCLSLRGIAREVAAYTEARMHHPEAPRVVVDPCVSPAAVSAVDARACPYYSLRRIEGLDPAARTPESMARRLEAAGISCHSLPVDITNFVMLETGQPLHAFDAEKVRGAISVRLARTGERLEILDGTTVDLTPDMLAIVDDRGPIALAGIVGGRATAVAADTRAILLEAAHFAPQAIAGRARSLKLQTDSSMRYERGVDPELASHALRRATGMLERHGGGRASAVTVQRAQRPAAAAPLHLRRKRMRQCLGMEVSARETERILSAFGLQPRADDEGWLCTVPSWRFDLAIEEDLIEEVARGAGYGRIPKAPQELPLHRAVRPHAGFFDRCRERLAGRGYSEAVTYSFVEEDLERKFAPDAHAPRLRNPISSEQAVLRSTLCPSLLRAAAHNHNRGRDSVRLFEIARVFSRTDDGIAESWVLASVASGFAWPVQWGSPQRLLDFYDVKGDLENLFGARASDLHFESVRHPALHPGQSARLSLDGNALGVVGALHPSLCEEFGLERVAFLFELDLDAWPRADTARYRPWSEYPEVHRDLALLVDDGVEAAQLLQCVRNMDLPDLRDVFVFDVYRDPKFKKDTKSVALRLIFQSGSGTLRDTAIEDLLTQVAAGLEEKLGTRLRQ